MPPKAGVPSAPATRAVPAASSSAVPPLGYKPYTNDRFGFRVDYPTFFTFSPPPDNDDGQEWTWGTRAKMTAWGMHDFEQTAAELCELHAKERPFAVKKVSGKSCFLTGTKDGRIFWEKTTLEKGLIFGLSFEYDEALKTAFDPLVQHVNASYRTDMPAEGP